MTNDAVREEVARADPEMHQRSPLRGDLLPDGAQRDAFFGPSDERQQLARFISKCQVLAGEMITQPADAVLAGLRTAVDFLPVSCLSVSSRAVVHTILTQFVGRLLQNGDIRSNRAGVSLGAILTTSIGHAECGRGWSGNLAALQHVMTTGVIAGDGPRVDRMLRYMAECFQDSTLRLERVARAGCVSTSSARRLLKQRTGQSFVRHLRQVRVSAARALLEHTSLSIKEIAARVGYKSVRHFAREFTRVQEISPIGYRRSHRP